MNIIPIIFFINFYKRNWSYNKTLGKKEFTCENCSGDTDNITIHCKNCIKNEDFILEQ